MLATKSAGAAKRGLEGRYKCMRRKRLSAHRRRVREDLDELRDLYNNDEVDLIDMDFVHVKNWNEILTAWDIT